MNWRVVVPDPDDPGMDEAWDALAGPEDFYLSATLNRTAERMRPQHTAHRAFYDERDRLRAVLPAFLVAEGATSPFIRPDLAVARLSGTDPGPLAGLLPTLHLGSRQIGYSRPLLAPDLTPETAEPVLRDVLTEALHVAEQEGARSVSMLYVEDDREALRTVLRDLDFAEFHTGWDCRMETPWPDFDGYLASRSAARRTQVRRERAKLAAAGVTFSVTALETDGAERLAELEAAVHGRHGNPQDVAKLTAMLVGLAEGLRGRTVLVSARRGPDVLGFALLLRWHDQLYLANVGLDHAAAEGLPLYFGLAFYEPVEYAVAHGIRAIDYGHGSWLAKRARGCRLRPRFGYLRCFDPGLRTLIAELTAPLREVGEPSE